MDAFHVMKTVRRAMKSGGADPSPPPPSTGINLNNYLILSKSQYCCLRNSPHPHPSSLDWKRAHFLTAVGTKVSIPIFTEAIGQSDFKDRGQRGRGNVFFYGMEFGTEGH